MIKNILVPLDGSLEAEGALPFAAAIALGTRSEVDWKVLHGDPAETIIETTGGSYDSIVAMATHGRSGLGRWILGSVTDKVVRTSESPTLVVRPGKS